MPVDFEPIESGSKIDFEPIEGPIQKMNPTGAWPTIKSFGKDVVQGYTKEFADLGATFNEALSHVGDAVLQFVNIPKYISGEQPVTRDTFMPKEGLKPATRGLMMHNPLGYTPGKSLEMGEDGKLRVVQVPQTMSPLGEWLADTAARAGHEMVTPENVALAGVAGGLPTVAQKALGIGFGVPMLKTAAEQVGQGDYQGATINAVLGALAAGSSVVPRGETQGSGLQPGDIQTRPTPGDIQRMAVIPPELQLEGPKGNFVAGPHGVVDFQELSSMEQQRYMEGSRPYVPPQPPTGVTPGMELMPRPPQVDARLAQHVAQQPLPPENPTFAAGPQGVAPINAQIGKLFDVAQPVERKLIGPPQPEPFMAGPTTLPQTLSNSEQLLRGDEPQLPTQRQERNSGIPLSDDLKKYEDLSDQLKAALANKDFDKFYDLQKEIETVKNKYGGKMPSEKVKPNDMRPAINLGNGKILVGEFGDAHADVLERNGIKPDDIPHPDARRGFVDVNNPKNFLDRKSAETMSGVKGTADAGGLDSQDLPGASVARLERMIAEQPSPTQERNSGIPLKAMGEDVKKLFDKAKSGLYNRERSTQLLDAADNTSKVQARQAGNRVRESLKDKVDQEALTFVTESGGDRRKLLRYQQQVAGKNPTAEAAVARALANLNNLIPHSQALSGRLEQQRTLEQSKGADTGFVANYMKHAYEVEDSGLFDSGTGGTGVSTSFLKPRSYPDYATAIEKGEKPKSLNAADLLESRISAGQRLLNRYEWANQLKELKTPSGPFAADLVKRGKQWTAPDGYEVVDVAPGVRLGIQKQYSKFITNVLADSMVRGTFLGDALLSTEAFLKHSLLMFDTYHMFRMMWSEAALTGKVSYKKGLSVLEYDKPTIQRMVKNGDITPDVAKWVEGRRPTAELLLRNGLNVGRLSEAMFSNVAREVKLAGLNVNILGKAADVIQNKTFVGTFNKWIFEKMTRGAMMETALYEFDRTKANNPSWTDAQVAAHTSKQINVNFGNLQRQGIFKSQTARDLLQVAFLAPQWAEAMAQKEVRAGKQLAEAPFTGNVGTLAKGVAVWTVAALALNQFINMASRGQPTWDNKEDGHKLDAWIPSIGKGDGYWLSPFSSSAEYTHSYIKGAQKGDSPLATTAKIAGNKLSPLGRAATTIATRQDYSGSKLSDADTLKQAAKSLVPTPLPFAGVMSETPGSVQRQAISSVGLKVDPANKTDKFDGLSLDNRLELVKQEKTGRTTTYQGRERGAEQAASANIKRGKDIFDELPRADRNWLESRNLLLSGYDNKIHYKGVDLPLSTKEQARLGELVASEYAKAIALARTRFDDLPEAQQTRFFTEITTRAREVARHTFMAELMSDSVNESNISKRYNTPGLDFRPIEQ